MHGQANITWQSRREFLANQAFGIGGVALAWLLAEQKLLAERAGQAA